MSSRRSGKRSAARCSPRPAISRSGRRERSLREQSRIQTWPQVEVMCFGGVPGYNYEIDASTNLPNWQAAQQYQIAHLGDVMDYLETNSLPYSFYKLNLAP